MVSYFAQDTKIPKIKRRPTNDWIKRVAVCYGKVTGDIAFVFCSDKEILKINKEYLNHDYYTDIITFDYSKENTISGDIFISLDTVLSNSKKFAVSFEEELHRVIIHGVLHLCGLKDKTTKEQTEMTKAENRALELLTDKPPTR